MKIKLFYDEEKREIYHIDENNNMKKLYLNEQRTKNNGGGYPVIYIGNIPNSTKKWISLNKLSNGENIIDLDEKSNNSNNYNNSKIDRYNISDYLSQEEKDEITLIKEEISKLENRMIELKNLAISRRDIQKINPFELSKEDRLKKLEEIKKLWGLE